MRSFPALLAVFVALSGCGLEIGDEVIEDPPPNAGPVPPPPPIPPPPEPPAPTRFCYDAESTECIGCASLDLSDNRVRVSYIHQHDFPQEVRFEVDERCDRTGEVFTTATATAHPGAGTWFEFDVGIPLLGAVRCQPPLENSAAGRIFIGDGPGRGMNFQLNVECAQLDGTSCGFWPDMDEDDLVCPSIRDEGAP